MTEAVTSGCTLEELAARRGLTVAQARALLRPFLEAGLVDRLVAFAISSEASPA